MTYTIRYPEDNGVKYHEFKYPGGEKQVRFDKNKQITNILTATEVHVIANIQDGEVMGLALLSDALQKLTFEKGITRQLILPYFPYSRADRRFCPGDCHGLLVFSKIIYDLGYDQIVTLDAHSEGMGVYFDEFLNVSPTPIIEMILGTELPKDTRVLLPDEGAKRYRIPGALLCHKKRDPVSGKLSGFEVPDKSMFENCSGVLIIDDICDGGGTFVGLAAELPKNLDLYLYVTHGIFSQGLEPLSRFKRIFTTDTWKPIAQGNLTVIPAMGLILENIKV